MSDDMLDMEERKKRIAEADKRLRERRKSDIKKILEMPEGRRFVWQVLSEAGVFRCSFSGDQRTNFNEGKRDIGLFVFHAVMNANPDAFTKMQREAVSDKLTEEAKKLKGGQGNG